MKSGSADMAALEATLRTIGQKSRPRAWCLSKPGCARHDGVCGLADPQEGVCAASLRDRAASGSQLRTRHAGREYVASIRDFWRVCAGCNAEARGRVEKFLRDV